MKFYLGVTDTGWYNYLSKINPEDVNFWRPGKQALKAIPQGAPFLFKLKGKINKIGGLGFFYQYTKLPISVAWETFTNRNGFNFFDEFLHAIIGYRADKSELNPEIGCIVLTNPVFFKEEDWIEVPSDWKSNIVSGSTYSDETPIGKKLWQEIESCLHKYLNTNIEKNQSLAMIEASGTPEYQLILAKARIGQGAFKTSVSEAYQKRCSISGERTLPVLEAAHIRPYALAGPNLTSNGLLLRSDIHKLFDAGYLTVTTQLRIEVSARIKSEFENGKEYYQFDGKPLFQLPGDSKQRPLSEYLEWHNQNVYR